MSEPDDLWGRDSWTSQPESAVIELLERQASLLASKTNGTVQGVVKQRVNEDTVWVGLYARVPALNNYEYKLLTLAFPLLTPPLQFPSSIDAFDTKGEKEQITHMETFREWLRRTLSSDEVDSVIGSLMHYGKGVTAETS